MKKKILEILQKTLKFIKLVFLTLLVVPSIWVVNNLKKKWEKSIKEFKDFGY